MIPKKDPNGVALSMRRDTRRPAFTLGERL